MTPHLAMSGSVTISTFYCIVSKAFIGFSFLGRQFLKCLLFLVLTKVLSSASLHHRMLENVRIFWSTEANLVCAAEGL